MMLRPIPNSLRLAALLCAAATTMLTAQQIPGPQATPQTATSPRTGMVIGRVVDADGAPVPEAIVRLGLYGAAPGSAAAGGRVMADRDGRFFFADLPAGRFFMEASKPGYANGVFGQREPYGQSQQLTLADGERVTDVTLKVWKYGVISGSVVDEAGEPVVGVGVRVLERSWIGGRPRFGNLESIVPLVSPAVTDDRGRFRVANVLPGTYVALVPSPHTSVPVSMIDAITQDVGLRNDLFFAGVWDVAPLGQPRMLQSGDTALLTWGRVVIPPAPVGGHFAIYPTTYAPSARTPAAATQIAIKSGEERDDITIALRPVAASRVSGRVVAPDGSTPPPMVLRLSDERATGVAAHATIESSPGHPPIAGHETALAVTDAAGNFTFLAVPPGEYHVTNGSRALDRSARQSGKAYWLSQTLNVGAGDISNLTVALRPAVRIEGRAELPDVATGAQAVFFGGFILETPSGEPGRVAVPVDRDRRFSQVVAGGRYLIKPSDSRGWFAESVILDGKDVLDRVIDLQSDATNIVITYTTQPSRVSGIVKDGRGSVSDTAIVLAFPTDQARWVDYGTTSRMVRSTTTSRGAYAFEHLPAGSYHLIAIDFADSKDWKDPKRLGVLAGQAETLTIAPGEHKPHTLDLTVKAVR